ncbi:MAG: hypothetical protein V7776_22320 [Halopseudomonas aestusnigri]
MTGKFDLQNPAATDVEDPTFLPIEIGASSVEATSAQPIAYEAN